MTEPLEPIIILMADDDLDDCLLVQEALTETRLANEFHIVNNGVELIDYLTQKGKYSDSITYPQPDLILLDLNMPQMGGREALEIIKVDPNLKMIPVVILTTSKAEEDILKTYDLGANGFVTKPVTFENLVKITKTVTEYWCAIVKLPKKITKQRL